MKERKKQIIIVVGIVLLLIIGTSFALLTFTTKGEKKISIEGGKLTLILDETSKDGIDLSNLAPVKDEEGKEQDAYTFSLKNNSV